MRVSSILKTVQRHKSIGSEKWNLRVPKISGVSLVKSIGLTTQLHLLVDIGVNLNISVISLFQKLDISYQTTITGPPGTSLMITSIIRDYNVILLMATVKSPISVAP